MAGVTPEPVPGVHMELELFITSSKGWVGLAGSSRPPGASQEPDITLEPQRFLVGGKDEGNLS